MSPVQYATHLLSLLPFKAEEIASTMLSNQSRVSKGVMDFAVAGKRAQFTDLNLLDCA
jgi:hypothetical protein